MRTWQSTPRLSVSWITATDDAVVTATGSGVYTLSEVDAGGDVSVDGSNVSGTLNVILDAVTGTSTITSGSGAATITTATGGATNITLGLTNGVTDQVITHGTVAGTVEMTNFNAGATGGDAIDLSIVGLEAGSTGTDLNTLISNTSLTAGASNVVLHEITVGAFDLNGVTANSTILVLDGDFALSSMTLTALVNGGTFELEVDGATQAADQILVAWDDGSNSYLGLLSDSAIVANNGNYAVATTTLSTAVTFVGVSDVTTLDAANFGTGLIA